MKKTVSTLREMLKLRTMKMRKKMKTERDVRVAKEAESSPKDKKKTRKEKVTVTILVDQTSLKEEGRNKKYSFISQNDFLILAQSVNDQQTFFLSFYGNVVNCPLFQR